ncbi:nesprin-1, partial [Biomphalaria glabrata]
MEDSTLSSQSAFLLSVDKTDSQNNLTETKGETNSQTELRKTVGETVSQIELLEIVGETVSQIELLEIVGETDSQIELLVTVSEADSQMELLETVDKNYYHIEVLETADETDSEMEFLETVDENDSQIELLETVDENDSHIEVLQTVDKNDSHIELLETVDENDSQTDLLAIVGETDSQIELLESVGEADSQIELLETVDENDSQTELLETVGGTDSQIELLETVDENDSYIELLETVDENDSQFDVLAIASEADSQIELLETVQLNDSQIELLETVGGTDSQIELLETVDENDSQIKLLETVYETDSQTDLLATVGGTDSQMELLETVSETDSHGSHCDIVEDNSDSYCDNLEDNRGYHCDSLEEITASHYDNLEDYTDSYCYLEDDRGSHCDSLEDITGSQCDNEEDNTDYCCDSVEDVLANTGSHCHSVDDNAGSYCDSVKERAGSYCSSVDSSLKHITLSHSKERELQETVQRQENFQQLVQNVTTKMEKLNIKLAQSPASVASSLENQISDYEENLKEIESIQGDITQVRERGEQLINSPDSEGSKAMEATLTMLQDRFNNLQLQAEERGRQLQDAQRVQENHAATKKVYKKNIRDLQEWVTEMKIRQDTLTLISDDPEYLRTLIDDNKEIQEEINNRLCQLSDLALQCDIVCQNEKDESAEKLRMQLADLQNDLGQFKLMVIEKQGELRSELKDIEKRKQEIEDHEASVQRMQKLMADSKLITSQNMPLPESDKEIYQELVTDIIAHKDLVQQISDHQTRPGSSSAANVTEWEMREAWLQLGQEQRDKMSSLQTALKTKSGALSTSAYGSSVDRQFISQFDKVMESLHQASRECNTLLKTKDLQSHDAMAFQQQYQSVLQDISSLLDLAQEKLFSIPSSEDSVKENENFQKQLKSLQQQMTSIAGETETLFRTTGCSNSDAMQMSIKTLTDRIKLLAAAAESQGSELFSADRKWKQYQMDVGELKRRLLETQELVLQPMSSLTLEQLVENNLKIERELIKCEQELKELKVKESSLTYPKGAYLSDLSALQSNFIEIHRRAMERRSTVQMSISLHDQYQKMLKDYETFLETAEIKLKSDSITARDLSHLNQQLLAHKDFFSDLEANKAMLDSLANQCDEYTKSSLQHKLSTLINLTSVLVDKASLQGQRLERLAKDWTDCDDKLKKVQKKLQAIEFNKPKQINCADSLTTIQSKLSRFKSLQLELTGERNIVYEVVERGKSILHSVNCPSLESDITDLAEKWVALNTELTNEMKRTEILGDQLSAFETEAALLSSWLTTAKMKLTSFRQLSPNELETIAAVRNKVEKVLEFRKEIENQLPLKNRVLDVGNKLLQNKNYDTRGLSDRLSNFEEEWKHLELGVSDLERILFERQMELMPSRQTLMELTAWINKIKKSLAKDAQKKVETISDIELMIQKYKDYKIELTSRQMPVDFVNQQILAPQPDEINVPHEKLEFAEKLGHLNRKWKEVLQNVNDRLNTLKTLYGKWEEFEQSLKRLQTWFTEQEDTIRRYKLIGHEVGVKQTLRDLKSIQHQLKLKSEDIKSLQVLGNNLIDISHESPGCQQSVRDSLLRIEQNWTRLDNQVKQMEDLLSEMTDQWSTYHADLASLNILLTQTEYSLNQYNLVAGDVGSLRSQVARLQILEKEFNLNIERLNRFTILSEQLKHVCEPDVQADIQRTVSDLQDRWNQLSSDLTERCYKLKQCLSQWENLESQYRKIQCWLDMKESECSDKLLLRDDPTRQQASLNKIKEIQSELDNYQSQMSSLYHCTDLITKYLSPSTLSVIKSRNTALEQRMLGLRKQLNQQMSALTEDLSQLSRFSKAFEAVQKFLSTAEAVLRDEDPDRAAEEDVLKQRQTTLSELLSSFIIHYNKLDAVNDLGYRLALNDFDATRLKELNHKWQRLYGETNDRCRKLQEHLLVQQDFSAKCQTWMTFLAQTEKDLARELKGNLNDLKDQLRHFEHFESEAYSHQQVLYAIISDGMRMMRAGEVEDREEFQKKLNLLSDQWQSVSRRVHQRRVLIEELINHWNQLYILSRQLKEWLQEKEDNLKACEYESDSLHVIRTLIDKVKTTQRELTMQEATYNKIQELGAIVLQYADLTEAETVQEILSDLQNRWLRIFGQLGEHMSRFKVVNKQWLRCENDIDELLLWLKDIRLVVQSDLPTTYEEIQKELNICRDISMDFSNSEGKRQDLIMKERQLSKLIQTEDMNILRQRITLLNKQWEELQQQTQLREQRLTEALYRWTNVNQDIQSLTEWIDAMAMKITSTQDIQVEELLNKLEKDYKEAMEKKEVEKNEIVSKGKHLIRISSEIRASDIEQKVLRLEEKWEHLQSLMDFRHRKLKETVLAVKQLDASMKNLSQWLSSVEQELSCGLAYKETNLREIQIKLEANKDLQKEIESHGTGVSAVLNLCEVLLHDTDACPTETEFTALQHARKNLEKRWRNICTLSPQRRTRLEETWQMWQKFQNDCQRFSDWLTQAERDVRDSELEIPNVRVAKVEIMKYENLQRNVHDHLGDLEQINRHYCQLAKEGRTDMDGSLRVKMTDLNNRWDLLQQRVTEIMKKLKKSANILEDFETTRSSLMTWLRQVELQLTEIEDITNLDLEGKVTQLRNIEDEIHTLRHRMEYLDQAALYLIQKGDSHQALRVQGELEEYKTLSKRILERVVTNKLRIECLLVAQ